MVSVGQFITVALSGLAPRGFLSEAPSASDIQGAIQGVLNSDGLNPRSVVVTGGATVLAGDVPVPFQGDAPYVATITVVAGQSYDSPDDLASIVAHDVGVAVGAYPQTIGAASIGDAPTPTLPASSGGFLDTLASNFNTDVQFVGVGLLALAILALIILAPELKRAVSA
jgi:hypothetical protein